VPFHKASTQKQASGALVSALAMLAELPLTPEEKAEAVRRMLAEDKAKEEPKG
jgi:hypothetical protein